jgi:hypothetical protein
LDNRAHADVAYPRRIALPNFNLKPGGVGQLHEQLFDKLAD